MFDTEDNENQESPSDLGQARNIFLSPTSNRVATTNAQKSRKRKLSDVEGANECGEALTIVSHPSLSFPQAQKLIPRLQLPRSCLPLAYLDPVASSDHRPGPGFFSAHIEVLEESAHDDRRSNQPTVLIAQSAFDDGLFAIERVKEGLYAMCRLGVWASVTMLERAQTVPMDVEHPHKGQYQRQPGLPRDKWWGSAAIEFRSDKIYDQDKKLGFEKNPGVHLCLQTPQKKLNAQARNSQELSRPLFLNQTKDVETNMVEEVTQDPEEMLIMVRVQYQEALYASKSSLAYFAKGPLSRARAAFSVPGCSANNYSHLISFLRSCILSLATVDTKYREALPGLIRELPFESPADDECTALIETVRKRSRRSKKISIGKNGLYPGEDAKIARWWLTRDLSSAACDALDGREEATRSAVLEQKARETQLQIILSLETLALESLATGQPVENLPKTDFTTVDEGSQNKKKNKKLKKAQDLSMLLDLLVDRLCIWQSMSRDEMKTPDGEERLASQHGENLKAKTVGRDHLRQFCIDVVLPFYGARLPVSTALLCQKLGGPKQPSPRRPPLAKSASAYASLKPGASVQRQLNRQPRRTLERVLTDERFASQKPPPPLSRSATDPAFPQVKREVSDPSLASIPLNRVAMHKRYSQREVDLHATSQANEAKLKKKTRVEQELQGAIAALKKPNPRMAVKELVEDAERRAAASHSRKPRKPTRNAFVQNAQVMATPSNNRHKDVYGAITRQPIASLPETEGVPSSSVSCVPSSSRKVPRSPFLAPDSTRKPGSRALPAAETPTRGTSKLWSRPPTSTAAMETAGHVSHHQSLSSEPEPLKGANGLFTSTPWPLRIHETPPNSCYASRGERSEEVAIDATPIKAPPAATKAMDNPPKAVLSPSSQGKEESIYATLGWDDDVDEI